MNKEKYLADQHVVDFIDSIDPLSTSYCTPARLNIRSIKK